MQLAARPRRAAFMGLTPLIDMIFLLLLFFLLGSDFVTYGQSRRPAARHWRREQRCPPVLITLSETGALSWNGAPANAAFLSRETARLVALNEEQTMVLAPLRGQYSTSQRYYGRAAPCRCALHHAGTRRV